MALTIFNWRTVRIACLSLATVFLLKISELPDGGPLQSTDELVAARSGENVRLAGAVMAAAAWPVGSVFVSVVDTDPAVLLGFGTWSAFGAGKVLVGLDTGDPDFDTALQTGGSKLVASQGDNAVSLFREAPAGTNAPSTVNVSVSVNWPAEVPTFAGTVHSHGLPISHQATALYMAPVATFGTGTTIAFDTKLTVIGATGTNLISVSSSLPALKSQGVTAMGLVSWPASTPSAVKVTGTAIGQVFTGVTGSVSAQVFTGIDTSVVQPYIVVYFWERTA